MIKIDGSIGYGQVLRTAIGLSALLLKPVKIFNIRIRRPKPGLRPQHLAGVKIAAEFCAASIRGAKVGSTQVEFIPKYHKIPSFKKIDIGTAGSICLLLQTLTPLLIFADKEVTLEILGGTDVRHAPTTTYFQHVFCFWLKQMGAEISLQTLRHGFYPKGGGRVRITFKPIEKLKPLELTKRKKLEDVGVWSIASKNLQKARVAERQIEGFEENFDLKVNLKNVKYESTLSPGSSFNVITKFENCVLGVCSLGERGKRAEDVGREAALEIKRSLNSEACLDRYMSDQILPFLALAEGSSRVRVEEFTEHVMTNIKVIEVMLRRSFEIDRERKIIGLKK